MKLGIVGLPNVGKSTLFNAITQAGAECANYPFCTIESNVGVVAVPDERLDQLARIYNSEKIIPAILEFVDIAGLVKGASKGEGLGNKFLANIREVDAIIHVVRCFEDDNIIHVENNVNPLRDIEIINLELILSDVQALTKRIERVKKELKSGDKRCMWELEFLDRLRLTLDNGDLVRSLNFSQDEIVMLKEVALLTAKPVIYVLNVSESDCLENNSAAEMALEFAKKDNANAIKISVKIEQEIASLDPDEKKIFLEDMGVKEAGLNRLAKIGYATLDLISYLTAGPQEVRAWTIKKGTRAPAAAGKIHTDFERGFIRAEVVAFDDLIKVGGIVAAREKGMVRSEGKEYTVNDGDVILFRFNV